MDKVNVSSENDILNALENEFYLNLTFSDTGLSIVDVKTKILEFSKFLNSVGRLSLLRCEKSESEEFVSLLLTLKRSIKSTLSEIGYSHNKNKYEYTCCECNEIINIEPNENFWTCLQNHEHVEYLYTKFLTGNLDTVSKNMANAVAVHDCIYSSPIAGTSTEFANENTDSGIDNEICEGDHNETSDFTEQNGCNEDDVNNFRFNFVSKYDDAVETKLYPERLMKTVRKLDRVKEYTIQKTGPFRAVCLLCPCDLITKTKISKFSIEDHTIGQRHIRNTGNSVNLNNLQKYHEFWLKLDAAHQAHQVYFKPDPVLKCVLCCLSLPYEDVLLHIQKDPHKKNVLNLFEKNNNVYYLIDLHVQVYGVTVDQIQAKDKEAKKEKMLVKPKVRSEKTDSDSSPSSDTKEVKHNIIKSVENSASENVLDLIPNRFREYLRYLKKKANMIICELCRVTLPTEVDAIKKHIMQAAHVKASNIKPKKYNYYCEICNIKIPDEVAWTSHFVDGPNRHANMAESRKNKATEYECTICSTVIFGDDLSLLRHLSVNSKRDKKSKELKLPEPVNKLFKSKEVIESTAEKLTFEANDGLRYNQLTKECCTRLETVLGVVFEGCKAYPFGSRISGLGDQYSDLDVFIDTGGMYQGYKNQDPQSQVQLVRKAAGLLSKHKEEFQDFLQIPTARTPIVKLYHKTTEIECDLSFRHGLSVENTKFLRFCLDLQPITQPFILVLKKWSQHNNFTEHISTYALALTAIFYLQINNHLLSVKKLRELNPEPSLVIDGWETIKYTMPLEQMKTFVDPYPHSISNLLKDYFGYYAKFKYSEEVICPLLGHTILKKRFYEGGILPEEMRSYITQLQREEPEQFRAMSPMCIQDPFDLSHNLTKACQPGTLNKFKTLCDLSFKRLDSVV